MNTKELLEALKPYSPELSWGVTINQWFVVLWDYGAETFFADDIDSALQLAFDAVSVEPTHTEILEALADGG